MDYNKLGFDAVPNDVPNIQNAQESVQAYLYRKMSRCNKILQGSWTLELELGR
jgi:hypothetical protein